MIEKCDLPLTPGKLAEITSFCETQKELGRITVLGQIPEILRTDWLDEKLPENVRANKHVNVDPIEWRMALEGACESVIRACLLERKRNKDITALLMWRAALAFHKAFADYGIRPCHIDVKRNENTLKISERLPLTETEEVMLRGLAEEGQVLVPDPMLASGSSMSYAIELLNNMGFRNDQITVACVVAAPEGVFNLLENYPGIKIVAAALDGCLNSNAYIVDRGLGDAGEKYFCGNSLENFPRRMFTDAQWAHLGTYFK
jgi:uracil phosphoribosyltransferase